MTNEHEIWWEGFDTAINLVLQTMDHCDNNELPITIRDFILEEVDLYKKDG